MFTGSKGVLVVEPAIQKSFLNEKSLAIINELKERAEVFVRSGMKAMAKATNMQIQRLVVDAILRTRNMRLIKVKNCYEGDFRVYGVTDDGSFENLAGLRGGYFKRTKLAKWVGNIPTAVVNQIPDGLADRAYIFEQVVDPIIAVPIRGLKGMSFFEKKKYYAAVLKWE